MNLDELRAAVEAKYAPFELEVSADVKATFGQYLRLSTDARTALDNVSKDLTAVAEDTEADAATVESKIVTAIQTGLRAAGSGNVEGVLSTVGNDAATLMTLWEKYKEHGSATEGNS